MNIIIQIIKHACAVFLCLLCSLPVSYSQTIQERIKRKINDRLERKVEQKVDKKIDEAIDKIFEKPGDQSSGENGQTDTGTEGEVNVKVDEEGIKIEDKTKDVLVTVEADEEADETSVEKSTYVGNLTMELTEKKNGKVRKDYPVVVSYHIDEYQTAVEPKGDKEDENTNVIMIIDRKERKIIQKMTDKDGQKTAMILPMVRLKVDVSGQGNDGSSEDGASITETGRSKNILGYECREYKIDSPDELSHVWATDELGIQFSDFINFVKVKNKQDADESFNNLSGVMGFPLESITESKKDAVTNEMKITEIGDLKRDIFSLEGYEVKDIRSMIRN